MGANPRDCCESPDEPRSCRLRRSQWIARPATSCAEPHRGSRRSSLLIKYKRGNRTLDPRILEVKLANTGANLNRGRPFALAQNRPVKVRHQWNVVLRKMVYRHISKKSSIRRDSSSVRRRDTVGYAPPGTPAIYTGVRLLGQSRCCYFRQKSLGRMPVDGEGFFGLQALKSEGRRIMVFWTQFYRFPFQ
jgi:hypothetical protein